MRRAVAAIVFASFAATAAADPPRPVLEANAGIGRIWAFAAGPVTETRFGTSLALFGGVSLQPRLDVGVRASAFLWHMPEQRISDIGFADHDVLDLFAGPSARLRPSSWSWIAAAVGWQRSTRNVLGTSDSASHLALELRAGLEIARSGPHALDISAALTAYHEREDPRHGSGITPQVALQAGYRFH